MSLMRPLLTPHPLSFEVLVVLALAHLEQGALVEPRFVFCEEVEVACE